jgi:predicted TIM-barrel fold metal-dependent hydrolase
VNDVEIPLIISVDDHIQEPPNLWTSRLPSKYANEVVPHVIRENVEYTNSKGVQGSRVGDVWYYESQRYELQVEFAAAGTPPEMMDSDPITYDEMRPGNFDVASRLSDMDADHVETSLCFPNGFVRFCGQRFLSGKDKTLAALCVRAYNDFLVEQWCADSNGRLLGVGIIPLWDPKEAAMEVRRNAERGLHAVTFSELPTRLGLPSLYSGQWNDFLDACDDTHTIICIHVGSSSTSASSSEDAPRGIGALCNFGHSALSMGDWLLSGVLARKPNIKLMYSEAQAGWIPYLSARADRLWETEYNHFGMGRDVLPEPPSTYLRNQVYACITDDPAAIAFIGEFGSDNICYETDYPHPDGTFPYSEKVAQKLFGHLSDKDLYKVVRGNAETLLRHAGAIT